MFPIKARRSRQGDRKADGLKSSSRRADHYVDYPADTQADGCQFGPAAGGGSKAHGLRRANLLETDVEIHFCYVHQPEKPVADLRILVCSSPADLARQISALMKDYPLGRIETVRDDGLDDGFASAHMPRPRLLR